MKLPVKVGFGLTTSMALALSLPLLALGGSAALAGDRKEEAPLPRTGPAADYPVVIGEPFTIGTTVWTPNDQLNYDAVGMATVGDASLVGVTGAHKTLPLPSYVEVTSLQSGRTILVRLERRGPMVNSTLIELSPAAARQLGLAPGASSPVRVRRVNPPESERAMLRQGGEAPPRMDTPPGLLEVLRKKLAEQSPLLPPPSVPPTPPKVTADMLAKGQIGGPTSTSPALASAPATAATPSVVAASKPAPRPAPAPAAAPTPTPPAPPAPKPSAPAPATKGGYVVQVGAFSVERNARALAAKLGGFVERPGALWLVQIGPFTDRAKAGPALEKAHKAGYTDARIQHRD